MSQLTFKQYLESKEQLLRVIEKAPITIQEHLIKKYCSIPVNEQDGEKIMVHLKPKNKLIVEWDYTNKDKPIPLSVKFEGVIGLYEEDSYELIWNDEKIRQWILNNSTK